MIAYIAFPFVVAVYQFCACMGYGDPRTMDHITPWQCARHAAVAFVLVATISACLYIVGSRR